MTQMEQSQKLLKNRYMQALSKCIIMMGECTDDLEMIILQAAREELLNQIVSLEEQE